MLDRKIILNHVQSSTNRPTAYSYWYHSCVSVNEKHLGLGGKRSLVGNIPSILDQGVNTQGWKTFLKTSRRQLQISKKQFSAIKYVCEIEFLPKGNLSKSYGYWQYHLPVWPDLGATYYRKCWWNNTCMFRSKLTMLTLLSVIARWTQYGIGLGLQITVILLL